MTENNQVTADELYRRTMEWRESGCQMIVVHHDYTKSIPYGQYADDEWHRLWVNECRGNDFIQIPYALLRTCGYEELMEYIETQIGILNLIGAAS